MAVENKFDILFRILSSEQQTLQRTDQKATTLLSLIGIFSVLLIKYYTEIPADFYNLFLIFMYFVFDLIAIYFLLLVILPRLSDIEETTEEKKKVFTPTFFGGIVKYKSSKEYSASLKNIMDDPDNAYEVFAKNVYTIGRINQYKNNLFKKGLKAFVIAITLELLILISLYIRMVL